jgi:siroheme synthase-like protein
MPKSGSMRSNSKKRSITKKTDGNRLFPVFLKLEDLQVLIVGGGKVAEEKLNAILNNSPKASIRIISKSFSPSLRKLANHRTIELITKSFEPEDLEWANIVFSAVNDVKTSKRIQASAKQHRILHNAADKPEFCDFYLGSVVQKGNLKIGISTNGKSPTIAKRLKEILDEALPHEIDGILGRLSEIRATLRGNLTEKIHHLNAITSILTPERPGRMKKTRSK